jgi:hypothetical protein
MGHVELAGRMRSGAIEKQHGVCGLRDVSRDFVEVELRHLGVDVRQPERRPDAAWRADAAEQKALLLRDRPAASAASRAGPTAELGHSSSRSGPRLKTFLDRRRLRHALEVRLRAHGKFLKRLDILRCGRALMCEKPS